MATRVGTIQPMRFDAPGLRRVIGMLSPVREDRPANKTDQLPTGVTRGDAEQMANAAQTLLDVVRSTPAHVLDAWHHSTTDHHHRRILAALQGVRAALR